MEVNSICVCGAGTMGSGIAQVAAQAGYATLLFDKNEAVLEKARTSIIASLDKLVVKNKINAEQAAATLQHIQFINRIDYCLADVFIEAVVEIPEVKIALFNQLAELNHSDCIFATNTSSLSVTQLAQQIQRPERVIGMHFFNPPTLMKLVEVVRTSYTNDASFDTIFSLAQQMGKLPVACKDAPGFIVNRVARPYYIEALRLVEEGHTGFAQLDTLLENSGFKMGPFKLMDLIGNDINYSVSCSVYEQMGKPERFRPSYIQQEKVERGELGRKSNKGYYDYNNNASES